MFWKITFTIRHATGRLPIRVAAIARARQRRLTSPVESSPATRWWCATLGELAIECQEGDGQAGPERFHLHA